MRVDQLQKEFALQIEWLAYPLHPEIHEEGLSVHKLFNGRVDIDAVFTRLTAIAAELNLPFGARIMNFNSRKAQELGKWAEKNDCGESFHQAVYCAYCAKWEKYWTERSTHRNRCDSWSRIQKKREK